MPSHSRKASRNLKHPPETASEFQDSDTFPPESEIGTTKGGRKKTDNAGSKQSAGEEHADEVLEAEVTRGQPISPPPQPSILGQIPRTFPQRPKTEVDNLEELGRTEKVADESTPPQEALSSYGRTPPDLIPGLTQTVSPQLPYSQIGKGGFNTRSPPTSPPQIKSRPLSYGGPPPSHMAYQRASPYAYPSTSYGSPPALPHLPQPHFYNAQDVDVGLSTKPPSAKSQPPNVLKFTKLPGSKQSNREMVFAGSDRRLDVLSLHGDRLNHVGSLKQIPGRVEDAVFLSWAHGPDPFEAQRPLVALSVSGYLDSAQLSEDQADIHHSAYDAGAPHLYTSASETRRSQTITVLVYSLRSLTMVGELLHVPLDAPHNYGAQVLGSEQRDARPVLLQASGNYLLVGLGVSGEAYVFTAGVHEDQPRFECLTKVWTTLQPRVQRRDSSHARSSEQDASPADSSRGQISQQQPICSLNGRFLAYCPASVSRDSLDAQVLTSVGGQANSIMSRMAPSRPSISCEVESPDAPTLLGKVAKGVAQEIVRGSKWLGEKGMQAWNSYWSTEPASSAAAQPALGRTFSPPGQFGMSPFPPTHGESTDTAARDPEVVSIIDLISLQNIDGKSSDVAVPLATFQPLGGCSFLSFMPNGLGLLTASRKGDTYYIWDLFQIRYPRTVSDPLDADLGQFSARVRQVAKYERMSPSIVVHVEWEEPQGSKFAILTQNRTIHMYDLPHSALRWPPPRQRKAKRPVSAPVEPPVTQTQASGGLFATARNYASQAQPLFANLRGRAPSMSSGVSGIGAQASATGMRGGKVVAAGFSKSLGAASDTVANIRHAGQSKLHLRIEPVAGRLSWHRREQKPVLSVLDPNGVRDYYVRKTNPREGKHLETVSVFEARKPIGIRLPPLSTLKSEDEAGPGIWNLETPRLEHNQGFAAPLSFAEIETNAPYQPFHSDHRVTLSVYSEGSVMTESVLPTVSVLLQPRQAQNKSTNRDQWVFGDDIPTTPLNLGSAGPNKGDPRQYDSVVYRETIVEPGDGNEQAEQIVSTTRRRKRMPTTGDDDDREQEEGFFEDDTVVLDYAEDRV